MEDLIVVIEESLPSIVISVVDADTNIKIPPNTNSNSLGSLSDVNTPFAQDGQVLTFQSGEWVAENITDESNVREGCFVGKAELVKGWNMAIKERLAFSCFLQFKQLFIKDLCSYPYVKITDLLNRGVVLFNLFF